MEKTLEFDLNFAPVFASYELLLQGAWMTIRLSASAMAIGLVVAVFGAWAKTSGPSLLRGLVSGYVEIIRNTPFLVQIFFIYFGLPSLGLKLDPYGAALLAMVINVGAYATEIIRAGIESIPKGQLEAGFALGLKPRQSFRYIVIKPALRTVYPALTSQFIFLMLTSSVVSVISAGDLTAVGATIGSQTFASFEVYFLITAMYFAMSMGFSSLFAIIERAAFKYPSNQ